MQGKMRFKFLGLNIFQRIKDITKSISKLVNKKHHQSKYKTYYPKLKQALHAHILL